MNSGNDFYNSLPKKRMAAGAVFFDSQGRLLVLKPNYRDYCEIVGGIIERNESPKAACLREVKEELGLSLPIKELLNVDFNADAPDRPESIHFIFNGGTLDDDVIKTIVLQKSELTEYKFVVIEEAVALLGENIRPRITASVEALKAGKTAYTEEGRLTN